MEWEDDQRRHGQMHMHIFIFQPQPTHTHTSTHRNTTLVYTCMHTHTHTHTPDFSPAPAPVACGNSPSTCQSPSSHRPPPVRPSAGQTHGQPVGLEHCPVAAGQKPRLSGERSPAGSALLVEATVEMTDESNNEDQT